MVKRAALKRLRTKLFKLQTEARTAVLPRVKVTTPDGEAVARALEERSTQLARRIEVLEEIVLAMLDD
jgi:hypothetical protein